MLSNIERAASSQWGFSGPIGQIWVNAIFLLFRSKELHFALNRPKIEYTFLTELKENYLVIGLNYEIASKQLKIELNLFSE